MADRRVKVVVEAEIGNYRKGMQDAGKATEGLGKSAEKAGAQTEAATGRFSKLSAAVKTHSADMEKVGTSLIGIGAGLTAVAVGAGKAAMDWESAWAGVMKTNEGTAQQTQALEEDLRALTGVLPATHTEIAAVAEAAGQLGVGIDDVAGFSKVMLDLGETTNLSADEAATALARFSNIMGTSFDDADRLGSAIVGLGNNFATTEAEIVGMSMRIAAVGRQMGMSESDVLAMATAMSSVGVEAEAGGTAISMVMKKIDGAVREGGESLIGWAEAAGVSASEFAAQWEADPARAMVTLTDGLGAVSESGGDVNGMLADLGVKGVREADTLLRLASASGVLSSALDEGATAWEQNTALAEEAELRYETTESKIAIAWNGIKDAAIDAGGAILPVVATVAEGAAGIASAFAALPDPLKSAIGLLSGVAGVGALAAGGLLTLAPRVMDTVSAFRDLSKAAPGVTSALGKIGKTGGLAAGAAVAIGALVTAAVALHNAGQPAATTLEDVANQLNKVKTSGEAADWDELFDFGEAGVGLSSFSDALKLLDPSTPAEHLNSFGASVLNADNNTAKAINNIEKMDQLFATMDADEAAEQVNNLRTQLEMDGDDSLSHWNNLKEVFPEYAAEVTAAAEATGLHATESDLMLIATGKVPQRFLDAAAAAEELGDGSGDASEGLGVMGGSAEEAAAAAEELQEAIDAAVEAIESMGSEARTVQEAQDAWLDTIAGMSDAIKENGRTLDETTEKGRANRAELRSLADQGTSTAAQMADFGSSQEDVQAQLEGTYEQLVKSGEAFGLSAGEAEAYARELLEIPPEVSVESWMSDYAAEVAQHTANQIEVIPGSVQVIANMSSDALDQAYATAEGIAAIPGYKAVDVAVDDKGTPGQVQTRINQVTGKTEYVFVEDDGTVNEVQEQILNINGKDVPVYVKDDGTVVITQGKIDGIHGKHVTIRAVASTYDAEAQLNNASRPRTAIIRAEVRNMGQARLANGGIAGVGSLPRYSHGGRLPSYGKGTDTILGVSSRGTPTAWVDDGEFVTKRKSTQKYLGALMAINRDDPSVRHLAGYAGGGSVGREWSGASFAPSVSVAAPDYTGPSAGELAAAVSAALPGALDGMRVVMDSRATVGALRSSRAGKGGL